MKKYLPIIATTLLCFCTIDAHAMSGSLEITVPKEAVGSIVSYAKVAERDELEESRLKEWQEANIEPEGNVKIDENGVAQIEHLEEGVYQIQISGQNGYEFSRAIVSIPMWDEDLHKMSYEVTMLPKYTYTEPKKEPKIPIINTGDDTQIGVYIAVGIISLVITVLCVLECQNKYSTKGGP